MTTKLIDPSVLRQARAEKERAAAEAWAKAEDLKNSMIESGVNPLENKEEFDKVDAAYKDYDQLRDEVLQIDGELSRVERINGYSKDGGFRPQSGREPAFEKRAMSPGDFFVASAEYRGLAGSGAFQSDENFRGVMARGLERPVEVMERDHIKSLHDALRVGATTITGGGSTSAGPFIQNDLQPGFIQYMREEPSLAAVVSNGTTDSDVVEYVEQSAPTSAAAETAEDTAASESTYAYATKTTNVREITHYVPITRIAMQDAGQVAAIVENDLVLDVLVRLDEEIANGNASGQNLRGIYATSGIGSISLGGDSRPDAIHKAITTIRVAAGVRMNPDWIGMHPNDWEKLRLEKDQNGQYLFGPPNQSGPKSAWGYPALVSSVFTEGSPLVGNYFRGARLWTRSGVSVSTGLNADDFTKRRVSMLAAGRWAFAVPRPGAFCEVTDF